jgi:excinuclease ABC subunit C
MTDKKTRPIHDKLQMIPIKSGVYLYKDKNQSIIYVGKAKNLRNRVRSYFVKSASKRDIKTWILKNTIFDVEFFITDTEKEALILENNLIKTHKPKFNVRLKDDKTYPYIQITNEDYPQVLMTRQIIKDGSRYIGPYTNVYDVKIALRTIHKFFQIRTCTFNITDESIKAKKHKICLDYHIKRCGGPCEGIQSREDYIKIIKNVERFLNGRTSELRENLELEMRDASEKMEYEKAAKIRDTLESIDVFNTKRQKVEKVEKISQEFVGISLDDQDACICILKVREGKVIGKQEFMLINKAFDDKHTIFENFMFNYYSEHQIISDQIYFDESFEEYIDDYQEFIREMTESKVKLFSSKIGDKSKLVNLARINAKQKIDELKMNRLKKDYIPQGLKSLQRDLNLKSIPKYIECFDNSNMQGTDPVSSMVVFRNGKAHKSDYRKYKTKTVQSGKPDDFATMYEVVYRRYRRLTEENKPLPDLIVVDGGKGQLSSAVKALQDLMIWPHPIIGLAKRLEEVFVPGLSEPQNIPRTSSAIRILQQLRDESHRFAITFHRSLRRKRTLKSELSDINGIGPSRVKLLLNHFGSIKKVKEAKLDELMSTPGLPKPVADTIFKYFQETKQAE